jgi:transposase
MPLLFEQQPRESAKAFAAFSLYLSLGAERSTREVGKRLGKSEGLIERWSAKFDWSGRLAAHSAHLAIVEREAIEAAARGKAAEWESREQKLRETEWAMHEAAIAAAKKGLAAYMDREKVYANLADIARMLEIASKLGRLATGLGTDGERRGGDELPGLRVEVTVALEKIYGQAEPAPNSPSAGIGKIVDVEIVKKTGGEGQ